MISPSLSRPGCTDGYHTASLKIRPRYVIVKGAFSSDVEIQWARSRIATFLFGGAEIRVGEIGNPSGNGVGGQPVSYMLQLLQDSGTFAANA